MLSIFFYVAASRKPWIDHVAMRITRPALAYSDKNLILDHAVQSPAQRTDAAKLLPPMSFAMSRSKLPAG